MKEMYYDSILNDKKKCEQLRKENKMADHKELCSNVAYVSFNEPSKHLRENIFFLFPMECMTEAR
jgi:hypothetical protein